MIKFSSDFWWSFALYVLVAMIIFLPGDLLEQTAVFHLPAALSILMAGIWTLSAVRSSNQLQLRFEFFDGIVFSFLGIVAFSSFWSILPGNGGAPRPCFNLLSEILALMAMWFLFRQVLTSLPQLRTICFLLITLFATQSFFGLYQYFVEIPNLQNEVRSNADVIRKIHLGNMAENSPEWNQWKSRLDTATPMGTYPLTNSLGGFLGCGIVFLIGFCVTNWSQMRSWKARFFLTFLIFLVSICFITTKCRSAFVAVVFGVGFLFFTGIIPSFQFLKQRFLKQQIPKQQFSFFRLKGFVARLFIGGIALVLLLLCTILFIGISKGEMINGATKSLGVRLEYWEASLGIIAEKPIIGVGLGNFKHVYTRHKLPQSSEEISDPHNFVVEIAAVAGLPALFLFCGLMLHIIVRGMIAQNRIASNEIEANEILPAQIRAEQIQMQQFASAKKNTTKKSKNINNQSEISESRSGHAMPNQVLPKQTPFDLHRAYYGGLLGCWLAFFLSYLGEAPVSPIATLIATGFFLLIGIAFSKQKILFEPKLIAICLITLLIHLLAAGGIFSSNSAILIWLFAAMIVNSTAKNEKDAANNKTVLSVTLPAKLSSQFMKQKRFIPIFLSIFWGLLLLCVYFVGISPVLNAFTISLQAESETDIEKRIALFREAAAADSWSFELEQKRASELFRLMATGFSSQKNLNSSSFVSSKSENQLHDNYFTKYATIQELIDAQKKACQLAPQSASIRLGFAQQLDQIADQLAADKIESNDVQLLREKARNFFAEAIGLHPNRALFHAIFAKFLDKIGECDEAEKEWQTAFLLESQTPHLDQKLPDSLKSERKQQ
ncbi:MAG: O-antigen ligase family protein [Thermoguttaceae bacterium]